MPTPDRNSGNDRESIAALAGGLAHEIKNPLSTINLNLQLLEEEWADPQTPRERRTARKLQVLQSEVQRLAQTLEDFLRFVSAERLELQSTDLNELAAEVAEFVEPELAHNHIELRENYAPDLPRCNADRKLLKQAILNLILNAQQAMTRGGELILQTSHPGDLVQLEIVDTGPGIPASARDKVFEPFYSTKKDGTGLGLPMTRRIVEQHGGTVIFHSDPGKGTDFIIRLPVPDAAQGPQKT